MEGTDYNKATFSDSSSSQSLSYAKSSAPGSSTRSSDRRSPSAGLSADGSASGGGQKTFNRPAWMDEALARRDEARSSGGRPIPSSQPLSYSYSQPMHPPPLSHPPSGFPLKRPSTDYPPTTLDHYSRPPPGPPGPHGSSMPVSFDGYDDGRYKRPRIDDAYVAPPPNWVRPPPPPFEDDGGSRYAPPPPPGGQRPLFPPLLPPGPPMPPMVQHPAGPSSGPPRPAPLPTKSISKSHCVRRV